MSNSSIDLPVLVFGEPFRRCDARRYTEFVRNAFLASCKSAGCAVEPPVNITSGIDPTVRFVGSHISVLKPYLRGKPLPADGVVCLQNCVRTRNINSLGKKEKTLNWGSFFHSLGALLPSDSLLKGANLVVQFLQDAIRCPIDRILARVNTADSDLLYVCRELFHEDQIETDTRPLSYYRHHIGENDVLGRNFNLAIRPPGQQDAMDIGNVIVLEVAGRPCAVELAFGVSTILAYTCGLAHVLDCHPLPTVDVITKHRNLIRHLEDVLITATALQREGLEPTNKNNRSRILRKYLASIPALIAAEDRQLDKLIEVVNNYEVLEYAPPHFQAGGALFGRDSYVSSLVIKAV